MNNNFKKCLIALGLTITSLTSYAQNFRDSNLVNNVFVDREKLVNQHSVEDAIKLGFYYGVLEDSNNLDYSTLLSDLLPFSNYLTKKLNKLVILDVSDSDFDIGKQAVKGNYDIVYISSVVGNDLAKSGWIPVVAKAKLISSAVIMRKDIKINNFSDLKTKNIAVRKDSLFEYLIKYGLLQNGTISNKNEIKFNYKERDPLKNVESLLKKNVEGIIVSTEFANEFLNGKNKDNFYIAFESPQILSNVIMINPNLSEEKKEELQKAMLNINKDERILGNILKSLDNENKSNDESTFERVTIDELAALEEILIKLELPRIK